MNSQPATEKQIAFINTLIDQQRARITYAANEQPVSVLFNERMKAQAQRAAALWARVQPVTSVSKSLASQTIDMLKDLTFCYDLLDVYEETIVVWDFNQPVFDLLLNNLLPDATVETETVDAVTEVLAETGLGEHNPLAKQYAEREPEAAREFVEAYRAFRTADEAFDRSNPTPEAIGAFNDAEARWLKIERAANETLNTLTRESYLEQ